MVCDVRNQVCDPAEDVPERARKRLPRYPVPVLGLARLAVDKSAQSMGLGRLLLRFVLELAAKMADEFGCAGVVVDAKVDAVDFYAKYGFTPLAEPQRWMAIRKPYR